MEYYYHRTTRNVIYSFKTLFENIEMRRIDDKGKIVNQIKVPIALVSKNRGVVITDSQPDNTDKVEAVVPSMTYELTDFSYSSQDKQNPLERVQTR
ncbi:MAG: tail sheath stabilizer and completion protein, partial [Endozoicomonadaceae bacterium]|nr:tail sheath stabilizer and completion protein [Endozoicomonadaceae bacterium]